MKHSKSGYLAFLGGISGFVFFVLQFLWYLWRADTQIPIWVVYIIIISAYMICYLFYHFCRQTNVYNLPKVLSISKQKGITFVIEKNELMFQDSFVKIYYLDTSREIEVTLGIGIVEAINTSGYPQVIFYEVPEIQEVNDIINSLDNNMHSISAIKIRPSICLNDIGGRK